MSRWPWFLVSLMVAGIAFACGWLVPAHLRAVNLKVVEAAGQGTPTLVERGIVLVRERNASAAQMLFEAAQTKGIPGREQIQVGLLALGNEKRNPPLPGAPVIGAASAGAPSLTEFMVRSGNRERALSALRDSKRPAVQELLRTRALTNTVLMPPAGSSAGQAFDTAVSIAGLLLEAEVFTGDLSNRVVASAAAANRGDGSEAFENALLDLLSLGQRLDWGQLIVVLEHVADLETLHRLAEVVRLHADQLPVLFAAVHVSGKPEAVVDYAATFNQTGLADMGDALRSGAGGLNALFRSEKQLQRANACDAAAARILPESVCGALAAFGWRMPMAALISKWILFLVAGLFLAQALYAAWPAASDLEWPRRIRGFHWARNLIFALGFLLVVLLVSEPFLAAESQKLEFPFRVQLSTGDGALPAETTDAAKPTLMNKLSLLTLLLFFVLQLLIYITCLLKLSEIRRQNLAPRIKLKLLENEEHLFDAGLYLGFVGTIISLILVSLGVIKPSLMAAYSSTSFGILFVSFFKIFNLRPYRRRLLLEVEAGPQPEMKTAPVHPLAAPL